jgi:hypothetical protein
MEASTASVYYVSLYIYIYGSINSVYYVQGSFTGVLVMISHGRIAGEVIYLYTYIYIYTHHIIRIIHDQEFSFLWYVIKSNLSCFNG